MLQNPKVSGEKKRKGELFIILLTRAALHEQSSLPDANPVSVTTSHPDHASYRLFVISHADSFFLLLIWVEMVMLHSSHREYSSHNSRIQQFPQFLYMEQYFLN